MDSDFRDYRILITGAAGTVGLSLSQKLIEQGAHIIAVTSARSREHLIPLQRKGSMEIFSGDIKDEALLQESISRLAASSNKKFAVFHLAALNDAQQCEFSPKEAFENNALLTFNLLRICKAWDIKRIIYPSTAYVYGTQYDTLIEERFPLHPEGMYPLTKLWGEEIIKGYALLYPLDCSIVRISNVYGPRSKSNTIFGTILSQSEKEGGIYLNDLNPVRDFIYIDDVIDAFIKLLFINERTGFCIYNLSTGIGTSIQEFVERFCQERGLPLKTVSGRHQNGSRSKLILANELLFQTIHWRPVYSVTAGIKQTLLELEKMAYEKT